MRLPIYLDYMATTPVDPRVVTKMLQFLGPESLYANPSSRTHTLGWQAHDAVQHARRQVAALIHAEPEEIVWTSGATEANNLAIKGAAKFYQRKGRHIITTRFEHSSVLDVCRHLESEGFEVTYLSPKSNGLITLDELKKALRPDTILVSIIHVNNEIGVIQDIQALGECIKTHGALFHVDAAQSAGKIPIDLQSLPVDLLSLASHKVYGPKGIGALYVRRKPRVRLSPLFHGGGQENGLRSGTLPVHQIAGMGEAFAIARLEMAEESQRILTLRHRLWKGIQPLGHVHVNGDWDTRISGNLNVRFIDMDGEALVWGLKDLAVSMGSACQSAAIEPSHVLKSLGLSDVEAHSSLRFSMGRFTTEQEIDYATEHICKTVLWLRELAGGNQP